MDKFTKCVEFASSTLPDDFKDTITDGRYLIDKVRIDVLYPFQIRKWTELSNAFHTTTSGHSSIFPYLKSCEYAEKIVKENNESFELRLQKLEKENQELKALVYSSLDQINSLKENNSFLSEELQIMKISFDDSLREFEEVSLDNLGEQIISLLDKFDDVKEHNKSLSSRVLDLESLFEKNETPNLINLIDI